MNRFVKKYGVDAMGAMAVAIGYALKAQPLVLFSLVPVGLATNQLGGAALPSPFPRLPSPFCRFLSSRRYTLGRKSPFYALLAPDVKR